MANLLLCVCKNCGIRYLLGVNSVIVTFDEALRNLQHRGAGRDIFLGHRPADVSDTIALKYGEESWTKGRAPVTPAPGSIPEAVVEAARRCVPRQWTCGKCHATHSYPWCHEGQRRSKQPALAPPSFRWNCASCGKRLATQSESRGKKAKCPHCGTAQVVPTTAPHDSLPPATRDESDNARPKADLSDAGNQPFAERYHPEDYKVVLGLIDQADWGVGLAIHNSGNELLAKLKAIGKVREDWLAWRSSLGRRPRLYRADLHGRNLIEAQLNDADMAEANLAESISHLLLNLNDTDLSGANLAHCRWGQPELRRVILRNANLSGAELQNLTLQEGDWTGAVLRGATLELSRIEGAPTFSDVNFSEAVVSFKRAEDRTAFQKLVSREQIRQLHICESAEGARVPIPVANNPVSSQARDERAGKASSKSRRSLHPTVQSKRPLPQHQAVAETGLLARFLANWNERAKNRKRAGQAKRFKRIFVEGGGRLFVRGQATLKAAAVGQKAETPAEAFDALAAMADIFENLGSNGRCAENIRKLMRVETEQTVVADCHQLARFLTLIVHRFNERMHTAAEKLEIPGLAGMADIFDCDAEESSFMQPAAREMVTSLLPELKGGL